jgi:hypothetical protein
MNCAANRGSLGSDVPRTLRGSQGLLGRQADEVGKVAKVTLAKLVDREG